MVETQTQDETQVAQGEVIVRVDNLTKVFRDFWGRPKARAVNGVSFEVRAGEVFGLLGPNGSGKSTTIKMMLGLLNPTKGFIDMFGQSPRDVKTKERIGYLPEESYLYKYLNSTETLDFFGGLFALDPKEKAIRSKQLLDMVGLTATQMRTVGEFSKGMQRRIGLAQALINDPDLVILDEPTSGLDPVGCREIKDLILNLKARGKTVILSSHLLSDVEDVCDRAVIYYGGKIQQYGTLEELLTERDTIRFTLPALSEEAQQEVMDTIGKHVGADKVRVENPTQNLESFFLNVVENAIAKDEDTSGSTAGNEVAEFLRADDPVPTQAEKMLDRLADKEVVKPAATQEEPKPEEPKVDTAKLESLAGDEASKQPAKPKQAETKKSQNLDDAEDKLSGLLGGD
ncbi:MAG: ATP-binding cassette domain-containing protein [Verrucomicrobiales bacterium]|nr:ATP-binding cassette domain-containing protein [Verrucomicrobiales bacterium]